MNVIIQSYSSVLPAFVLLLLIRAEVKLDNTEVLYIYIPVYTVVCFHFLVCDTCRTEPVAYYILS